jgi:peptide chain release factor 1
MDQKELQLRNELADLNNKLKDPSVFTDKNYPKLAKRKSYLDEIILLFDEKSKLQKDKAQSIDLTKTTQDPELKALALSEVSLADIGVEAILSQLKVLLTPQDPNNDRDVIVEIRAAAGGDESSLFAGELYRMYARWAEIHKYKLELINESASEVGGFKEITFMLRGPDAYKNLKFEAGVHRVQRVPTTESQGRIHTSTTTVAVLPEA